VCDLETSRMGAPYVYDISRLRVNKDETLLIFDWFLACMTQVFVTLKISAIFRGSILTGFYLNFFISYPPDLCWLFTKVETCSQQ